MSIQSTQSDARTFFDRLGLSPALSVLELAWEAEAGPLASRAQIAAVDHQTLVIETASSVVMHELTLRRQELVRRLNKHFSVPVLKHISVRLARHADGN